MKRLVIAALAVVALGAVIAGAQVVTNPVVPPPTVCAYNTAPPTLASGQASWLQCDSTGALITSSGGGAITAAVTVANGADVAEGATTDAAATAGSTGTLSAKQRLMTTQLATINTTLGTPFQAGGSIANTSFAVTQSGTWTVQPGNTANTTPWLVTTAPSSSSTIGIVPVVSTAGESSHVLKASAGNTYSAYATNLTSTQGFFLLINATSAPADGAVTPLACAPLAPNGIASLNYSPGPPGVFGTGITAIVTSAATCFTKTTGVITAFISGSVQ